jgi:hypothetical protein
MTPIRSFWRMETRSGKDTEVYPSAAIVYCFHTSYDLKNIFNEITQRYKSAIHWKKRFHWDTKLKMWCTQSSESASEAEEILKRRVGQQMQSTKSPFSHDQGNTKVAPSWVDESKPKLVSEEPPLRKLVPPKYDISTDYLHYNKEDRTLSVEISDLPDDFETKHELVVYNPKTGNTKLFKHYKNDTDGSGEDVYGYRYKSSEGIELLIIND